MSIVTLLFKGVIWLIVMRVLFLLINDTVTDNGVTISPNESDIVGEGYEINATAKKW